MTQKLEQILETLIGIPNATHNRMQSERIIAVVCDLLAAKSVKLTKGNIGGFPYLTATIRDPNDGMLWFVSHLDVVPAKADMFKLRSDEKVHGANDTLFIVCDPPQR